MVDCNHLNQIRLDEGLRQRMEDSLLGSELLSIFALKTLTPVYQPIVDLHSQEVFGFEGLIRGPENSPLFRPLNLFHVAEEHGCLYELDWLARQIVIERYCEFGNKQHLFVNVTVNALMNQRNQTNLTLKCLQTMGLDIEQIVIELTELQPVEDFELFVDSINSYREMGFKVAIDDLGGGYNGLRIWSEVKPDFVKVDKHFVSDLTLDKDKQRFMETICTLAKGLNTKIIAEGVEDEQTLLALQRLGVDFVQGYFLKRPQTVPSELLDYQWSSSQSEHSVEAVETVNCLVRHTLTVGSQDTVADVAEMLLKHPELDYLPVVDNQRVQGMVWRRELMDLMASRFGRELNQRKSVEKVMDDAPIVVECSTPLVELSRMITDIDGNRKGHTFLITRQGAYLGSGLFMDLLRVMTDLRVQSAQYANPLSGLPGNVPIQNTVRYYLNQKKPFFVVYVDVDHFKPYNDHYSFEEGDEIIKSVARILQHHTETDKDFIGHIGGDDFVVISSRMESYDAMCTAILQEFNQTKLHFYSHEDIERGGILGHDRDGSERLFKLLSLSLGVLLVDGESVNHPQMITSYATKAKKAAKLKGGDVFAVLDARQSHASQVSLELEQA